MARSTTPKTPARRRAPARAKTKAEPARPDAAASGDTTPERKPRAPRKTAAKPPEAAGATTESAARKPPKSRKTAPSAAPEVASRPAPTRRRRAPAKSVEPSRVAALTGQVRDRLPTMPDLPDLPDLPEITAKRAAIGAGLVAAAGAAFVLWRASRADQPDYRVVEQDGPFEVREYPAMVTADTHKRGPRLDALNEGFKTLAAYIFAKSRDGEKLAMTAPVLADGDDRHGWRTRFIMPAGTARADLPAAPDGVRHEDHPPRRMAAVRFGGRADDATLGAKEGALRTWLAGRSYPSEARAVHAFYNSPMMPGPLRRNEVLVTLSEG